MAVTLSYGNKGLGLVASHSIKEGDVVFSDDPLLTYVQHDEKRNFCSSCTRFALLNALYIKPRQCRANLEYTKNSAFNHELVLSVSILQQCGGAETCFQCAFPSDDCRQITGNGDSSTKCEGELKRPDIIHASSDGQRVGSSIRRQLGNSSAVPCEHCGWAIFCGIDCLHAAQKTWHPPEICAALSASQAWSQKARQLPELCHSSSQVLFSHLQQMFPV